MREVSPEVMPHTSSLHAQPPQNNALRHRGPRYYPAAPLADLHAGAATSAAASVRPSGAALGATCRNHSSPRRLKNVSVHLLCALSLFPGTSLHL